MIRRNTRWGLLGFNKTYYEGAQGGGEGGGSGGGGEGGGGGNPPPPAAPPKTFTQEQVNQFLAEERRKLQTKQQTLAQELEQIRTSARLTEEEKSALSARIEELTNQSLTKEQQLTRDLEKANGQVKTVQETLGKERDVWQGRYATLLIENQITAAATNGKAYNNEQVLDLLKPKAKVAPVLGEDGKPTDRFQVVIKFDDMDAKTKQPVTLDLSPVDVVKRMTELPERYGNLFQSGVQPGVGKTRAGSTGEPDISKMTAEDFRAHRKTRGY